MIVKKLALLCLINISAVTGIFCFTHKARPLFSRALNPFARRAALASAATFGLGTGQDTTPASHEQYPELVKFVKKYRCSPDVEGNQENHHLKGTEIERIINAERMRNCIEKFNLHHLRVADKCLCQTDDYNLHVLSQTVKFKKYTQGAATLSLSEVQQLVTLTENTGFRDWVRNFGWDINGKITFFDTEDNSFVLGRIRGVEGRELPMHCKFNFVASLSIYRPYMEPTAQEWFDKRLNDLLNSEEGTRSASILPVDTQFDDSSIDFEQVKVDFEKTERSLQDFLLLQREQHAPWIMPVP